MGTIDNNRSAVFVAAALISWIGFVIIAKKFKKTRDVALAKEKKELEGKRKTMPNFVSWGKTSEIIHGPVK
jgi:putative Mn2+ efflux pump MntP